MWPHARTLATYTGALGIVIVAFLVLMSIQAPSSPPKITEATQPETAQTASVSQARPELASTSAPQETRQKESTPSPAEAVPAPKSTPPPPLPAPETEQTITYVARVPDPYPFPQQPFLATHEQTLAGLVNILCATDSGNLQAVSGSGIIIDPRGIILTNAHVAQYVLLEESGETNLTCSIRSGAPARALWKAEVVYIPPVWIRAHAADITKATPTGTGKHDYALLRITGPVENYPSKMPANFPSLSLDSREGIAFKDDYVLAASYPAEFLGPAAHFGLYPVSSIASIKELLTFDSQTVDLISLGGVAEAQSGSSGGPVTNAWGRLIGIITTTSEGATTADRDLRAITISYINRDLLAQTGRDLASLLGNDPVALAADFRSKLLPELAEVLIDAIVEEKTQ